MSSRLSTVLVPVVAVLALTACSGDGVAPGQGVTSPVTLTNSPATATGDQSGTAATTESSPAAPEPAECEETVTADVAGDLVVSGSTCVGAVTVDGNILVGGEASLVTEGTTVEGNVQGSGHRSVSVTGGEVEGNVQLENGGAATVTGVTIDGDLQSSSNSGPQQFRNNVIDGNLQCEGNEPAPTGSGNTVGGDKEGQCSGL